MDLDGYMAGLTQATADWDGEEFIINGQFITGKMGQAAIERVGQYLSDSDWKAGAYELTLPCSSLIAPYFIRDMTQIQQVATGRLFTVRNLDIPQSGGSSAFVHLVLVSIGRTSTQV